MSRLPAALVIAAATSGAFCRLEAQTTALLSEPQLAARYQGLAGASIALADLSVVGSNPAAAAGLGSFSVALSVMRAPPETDLYGQDLTFVAPVGSVGVFAGRFANREVGDLLEGVAAVPAGFAVYDRLIELAWARRIGRKWAVGLRGRLLWSRVFAYASRGYVGDVGVQGQLTRWLRVAASSDNLLASSDSDGGGISKEAARVRVGLAAGTLAVGPVELSVYQALHWLPDAGDVGASWALEGMVLGLLSLRAGYGRRAGSFGEPLTGWSYGLGLEIGAVVLDLARRTGAGGGIGGTAYATLSWHL